MFDRTFDEGMALVEETARYLDGKGREEARALPRKAAMLYAGESMRVTTRLMQAASWLLVQRAVRDGDMERADALNDRYRLGSREICLGTCAEDTDAAAGGTEGSAGAQRQSLSPHRAAGRYPVRRRRSACRRARPDGCSGPGLRRNS